MTNYQRVLETTLEQIAATGARPRLLLHACCAPCSSYTLEYLASYFTVTMLFYNPNISPAAEYDFRAAELRRYLAEAPCGDGVTLCVADYDPAPFSAAARGLEALPEGGERCKRCYRLRLAETARRAAEGGYDFFCTTLSISPHKDAEALNAIGGALAAEYGVPYLYSDFKKKGGYARSIVLSREYGLYRQNYCGCVYSKRAAEEREALHEQHS